MIEFDRRILRCEAPLDRHRGLIAPSSPGRDLLGSDLKGRQALRQTWPIQHREFDLGHIEPGLHAWGWNAPQSVDTGGVLGQGERPRREQKAGACADRQHVFHMVDESLRGSTAHQGNQVRFLRAIQAAAALTTRFGGQNGFLDRGLRAAAADAGNRRRADFQRLGDPAITPARSLAILL